MTLRLLRKLSHCRSRTEGFSLRSEAGIRSGHRIRARKSSGRKSGPPSGTPSSRRPEPSRTGHRTGKIRIRRFRVRDWSESPAENFEGTRTYDLHWAACSVPL